MPAAEPDNHILARAGTIADDTLFPAALATDVSPVLPVGHLDALADAGFLGLAGPAAAGGLEADFQTTCDVVEIFAGACLTTTLVWIQHVGAVHDVASTPSRALREALLEPLCRGSRRAGLALPGAVSAPPRLHARPTDGGWLFTGTAPFVSGWGRIDLIHAAARDDGGNAVWAFIEAREGPGLHVQPLRLVALNATATVRARFTDYLVPAERVTAILPPEHGSGIDPVTLRLHAAMATGVTGRCLDLLGPSGLDDELAACRGALDEATPEAMPTARAAAAELALRAAASLCVSVGSRALLVDQHAQRLAREATFLLVFGARAPVCSALLEHLGGSPSEQP